MCVCVHLYNISAIVVVVSHRRTVVSSLRITRITGFFFIFSVTTTFPPAAGCRGRDNVIASKSRRVLLSGFCVSA